jgi:hypothetical protein
MTWLINVDNRGTTTGFCLVDGGEVRYTKTLTTPYDLSRCLFDGLAKGLRAGLWAAAARGAAPVHGLHPKFHHPGHQRPGAAGLGLLVTDLALVEGLAATTAQAQEDLLAALVGDRWGSVSLDAGDEALGSELTARVNDLSARGARRLVIAVSGSDGADGEARAKGCILVICSARSRCCSPRNWSPTPYDIRAPGRACSTRSCTRPLSASCSTPTGGCERPRPGHSQLLI